MEPKAPCPAAVPSEERKFRVLVGVTGSVAALKLPLLVSKLLDVPGDQGVALSGSSSTCLCTAVLPTMVILD
ncbi:phosphopantothenoylcysteine decarboxylase isoform X5 [Mus musculus]|nr:phosphopantothenoylcysteine decarboxylase isoform X5 [Mus musculus]XP_030100364.1 phosphopantothenoylcysteine decarboxylase isoform X5 [Mus musculus]XP_036011084.1 phosphopantothenoylcysteine decarboxylase isoform X5 [Mus musculus]XP_036011085.1 phosphopantothenoylcysteine decarboxylase isoform X5 [Mus musculus]XP_036011086.1 phosphopantothenoylcysteine decarboxylase isoform X5 [Mus musculus]XP_036011087.1 phosphopantothenoylcysteine decarboxylase isoform X5 [Mus musculus]EDL25901.1 phosph